MLLQVSMLHKYVVNAFVRHKALLTDMVQRQLVHMLVISKDMCHVFPLDLHTGPGTSMAYIIVDNTACKAIETATIRWEGCQIIIIIIIIISERQ